jgi:hypothetical protein
VYSGVKIKEPEDLKNEEKYLREKEFRSQN